MYLLYVDESGDTGTSNSPSRYFVLSGFVVHETAWAATLGKIQDFRTALRARYGLKRREEIHAAALISEPGELSRIAKSLRLRLLRECLEFQASLSDVSIINIVVDKSPPGKKVPQNVFDTAWTTLIQRFENTISYGNFPGPPNTSNMGIVIVDATHIKKLQDLMRRCRVYNPVPNMGQPGYRQLQWNFICEDAVHRDSRHSFIIQLADVNAYFLRQMFEPNRYIKKRGARTYLERLKPVLCSKASRTHPLGIVMR